MSAGRSAQGHRDGLHVSCPWHSAKFDLATGACLQGPVACRTSGSVSALQMEEFEEVGPLPMFDVRLEAGEIYVRPRGS